jgi:outer membrane lipopolysaccharide assembly protein LptE/RlpB
MINKKLFGVITFIFLLSCGYQPIFSFDESTFSISKIKLIEKNKANTRIKNALKFYRENNNAKTFYDLEISSNKSKNVLSKDSRGDPKIFSLSVSIKINLMENNLLKYEKTFNKKESYNTNSNKFRLKEYEDQIASNMVNKMIEEIIIYLHSL